MYWIGELFRRKFLKWKFVFVFLVLVRMKVKDWGVWVVLVKKFCFFFVGSEVDIGCIVKVLRTDILLFLCLL